MVEDKQIFEIETQGQMSDFASENEQDFIEGEIEDTDSGKTIKAKPGVNRLGRVRSLTVDNEVSFNYQVYGQGNNNATVTEPEEVDDGQQPTRFDQSLEEGECNKSVNDEVTDSVVDMSSNINVEQVIEEKVDQSMSRVQDYLDKKFGDMMKILELERKLEENKRHLEQLKAKGRCQPCPKLGGYQFEDDSQSESTVYKNAVQRKRDGSSSSEEEINISSGDDQCNSFESTEKEILQQVDKNKPAPIVPNAVDQREAGSSKQDCEQSVLREPTRKDLADARADHMIQEAQISKARAYEVSGNNYQFTVYDIENGLAQIRAMGSQVDNNQERETGSTVRCLGNVDNDYLLLASHLDENTRSKIINQEYVDFSKLLRRDRPGEEDTIQQKMVMANKGGMSYWVPFNDKSQGINGYARWEQAFRVYLDVYTSRYLERTSELIQYNHIIQTASHHYAWENVYLYDRESRRHMERHPERSWGVILQQAWTMFLKDHLNSTPSGNGNRNNSNGTNNEHKSAVSRCLCFTFNRGECTYGSRCKFEHRCGFCGKFGHGTFNCRKASSSGHTNSNGNGNQGRPKNGGGSNKNGMGGSGGTAKSHGQNEKA